MEDSWYAVTLVQCTTYRHLFKSTSNFVGSQEKRDEPVVGPNSNTPEAHKNDPLASMGFYVQQSPTISTARFQNMKVKDSKLVSFSPKMQRAFEMILHQTHP